MTYDKAGRKLTMNDPNMGVWSYAYDALGNLTSQTDARGCVLTLTYDDLSRLDAKSSSGTCGQQINVNYDYDSTADGNKGIGRRTSMSDGSGSTAWKYDTRGRLTRETKNITGAPSAFVTEFAYNTADLPTSMEYPDGEVVGYEYNARMMLDTVIGDSTYVSDSQYDSAGRMTSRALGNGLTQTYGYYDWNEKVNNIGQGGRLETLATGSLQNLSYVYDKVGNVKQITNSIAGETSVYGYDELNRLTSWQLNQNPVENYSYDSAGNLDMKNGLDLEYDDVNHVHAVTSAGVNTYTYDDNGNQTTRVVGGQTVQLGYDAENRLVSVTGTNLSAQFYYNGDGQRVKSVINTETVYFAGGHYEFNDTTDEVTKHYFAGASRIAVRKYTVPQTTTLNYLLGDHLGSTSIATDAAGALLVETRYKPWGEVRWTTPSETLPTRYTFTGQYSHMDDSATDLGAAGFGLMFYNARWYDPALGRMAQADTIVPGGVQGLDRYAYVNNSPVRFTDPSGHCPEEDDECRSRLYQTLPGETAPDKLDESKLLNWYARELYKMYLEMWDKKDGWWWVEYGEGGFTIWEFMDIIWRYEQWKYPMSGTLAKAMGNHAAAYCFENGCDHRTAEGALSFLGSYSSSARKRAIAHSDGKPVGDLFKRPEPQTAGMHVVRAIQNRPSLDMWPIGPHSLFNFGNISMDWDVYSKMIEMDYVYDVWAGGDTFIVLTYCQSEFAAAANGNPAFITQENYTIYCGG